jgi:hypothetical protein
MESAPKKRIKLDLNSHDPLGRFSHLITNIRDARVNASQYVPPKTRLEEVNEGVSYSPLERGHMIMDMIRENIDKVDEKWSERIPDFERSRDQRKVHEKIMGSILRFVYGKSYGPNELEIKKYNRIKFAKSAIAFTAPRRFGKSLSIAIICAVLFMSVPNMEICIITQNARAAGKKSGLLGLIKEMLSVCFGMTSFEVNEKEHLIATFPDRRAIHAYSAGIGDG